MKKILTLVALCIAAGAGWADAPLPDQAVKVYTLSVKERMQNLELINVTAEKPAAADAEPLDPELQAILAEVEALEEADEQ